MRFREAITRITDLGRKINQILMFNAISLWENEIIYRKEKNGVCMERLANSLGIRGTFAVADEGAETGE